MDGFVLFSLLLAQQIAATPSEPLRVEALVVLGGHVSSSGLTELRVGVAGAAGGEAVLEVIGATPPVRVRMELLPGLPSSISVPLGVDFSRSPALLVSHAGQETPDRIPISYVRHASPPSVLAGALATERLISIENTVAVSSAALPRFAPAYEQVQALVVDGTSLAALDDAQLRAMLEYAGTCGRLMLIDVSRAVQKIFANRAACDNDFLTVVSSADDIDAAFLALLARPAMSLPADEQLARLVKNTHSAALDPAVLGYFWAGYLVMLLLLIARSQTRVAALGFTVISTLLVFLIWPGGTSSAYVAWAETSSTGRVARYTGIERLFAMRHGKFEVAADSFGTYPGRIDSDTVTLLWNRDRDRRFIEWNASAFQHMDKHSRGSFAIESTLRANLVADTPVVCNTGADLSLQAYLQWQGQIFAVPPLQPGTSWSASGRSALADDAARSPVLELLLRRSAEHATTLLQSLSISLGDSHKRAWLLRYESDQNGHSPCRG